MKRLTKIEMLQVSTEILERIAIDCQKNGYTLLKAKKYSDHSSDFYLYTVLAVRGEGDNKQYVTWQWNSEQGGLNHGHYISMAENAEKDYNGREYTTWVREEK